MSQNALNLNFIKLQYEDFTSCTFYFYLTTWIVSQNYMKSTCQSTHFHIRNIREIRHLLPSSAAAQLVHSLVTSRLDYCNALLHRLPDCRIKPLQRVQNIAVRIVSLGSRQDDIDDILHWLLMKQWILFKVLLVYKCKNDLAPEYLRCLCKPLLCPISKTTIHEATNSTCLITKYKEELIWRSSF